MIVFLLFEIVQNLTIDMMPNIEQLGNFWNIATFDIINAQFYFIENGDDVILEAFELRLFNGFFTDTNSDQNV